MKTNHFLIAFTFSVIWFSDFLPSLYTVASSARSAIFLKEHCFCKSMMYTKNKNGPNFETCGVPVSHWDD